MIVWCAVLSLSLLVQSVSLPPQMIKNQINTGKYEGTSDVNILANLIKVSSVSVRIHPMRLSDCLSGVLPRVTCEPLQHLD